tara:strand:- start:3779 stop:3973 length:195 start_codon:yes stop_codon:yes gene_type:complete
MKAHPTLIEKLVKTFEVYSGWRDEAKLKQALAELNFAVYKRQDGLEVLVDKDELEKQIREQTRE